MSVYNCFPFYDEFMLLDIRLAELADVVDKFVLVESNVTFAGRPKELFFERSMQRYAAWKGTVVPLLSYCDKPSDDRWENERAQRNAIGDYLKTVCKPEDLIILTDADEIPSEQAVRAAQSSKLPGRLYMRMYYYFLNCRQNGQWPWPAYCRYREFVSVFKGLAQSLRISGTLAHQDIYDAGWHFSYVMEPSRIAEKIGAFSHSEYDNPYYRDVKRIEFCRHELKDLFDRGVHEYELVSLDEMPAVVRQHPERYSEFIKQYESAGNHTVLQESGSVR